MPDTIRDGTGSGFLVQVDDDNQLRVRAKCVSLQHAVSEDDNKAFQVEGFATLASGTTTVMHITNNSSVDNMIITYIRHQIVGESGGTAFPNASNYVILSTGRTFASGGGTKIPVNMFLGSGTTANITVYDSDPVLAGTSTEFDRWYYKTGGDMNVFNKEGALIVPANQTLEISFIGDQTGGTFYSRVSFVMEAPA